LYVEKLLSKNTTEDVSLNCPIYGISKAPIIQCEKELKEERTKKTFFEQDKTLF